MEDEQNKAEPMPEHLQLRNQVKLCLNDADYAALLDCADGKLYRRGNVVREALKEFFERIDDIRINLDHEKCVVETT